MDIMWYWCVEVKIQQRVVWFCKASIKICYISLFECKGPWILKQISAASRCILVLFAIVWTPKKMHPKSSCNLFSIHISCLNYMKYSIRIVKNKNLFKRHKYPSPNAFSIKYFWTLSCNHWGGFWVSLNYPILNFKKTVCPKTFWVQHCW